MKVLHRPYTDWGSQPSPEASFINLCVREADVRTPAAIRAAAAEVRDWDAVVALAGRNRVAAFVEDAATRENDLLPAQIVRTLREAALSALAWSMALDAVLVRVTEILEAARLPTIVLKGPALVRSIYPHPVLRPYGDIDLTVQQHHEDLVAERLLSRGFVEMPHRLEVERKAHGVHPGGAAFHRLFRVPHGGATIEVHTDPLQLGLQPTSEAERWRRSLPIQQLPMASMLCPEDQLVQLSVHAHKHGFSRLIWLKDIDLLTRVHHGGLDWGLVRDVSRREGVQASVWYTLHLARRLLGSPVPSTVLDDLCPALPLRTLYRLLWPASRVANLNGHMRRRAVQFYAAESWRGMIPSLILMGRRRTRAHAIAHVVLCPRSARPSCR
ncbi:MAG: nucleotidyltransferase family protein [Chloroflexi bacterium]|nr:nucleotidyltransferase family protein [Chloroflexota bacterium]